MKQLQLGFAWLLLLASSAWSQVNLNPQSLDFGVVLQGSAGKTLTVQLHNGTGFKMTVTPQAPAQPFSTSTSPVTVSAGQSKNLTVSVPSNAQPGTYASQLVLNLQFQIGAGVSLPP